MIIATRVLLATLCCFLMGTAWANTFFQYNGHYYLPWVSAGGGYTYDEANNMAQLMGGYLVSIDTSAENAFVNSILTTAWSYIGAKRCANNNNLFCKSNTNDLITYSNWKFNEPNNHEGREACAVIFSKDYEFNWQGLWNDVDCSTTLGWVFEFDQAPSTDTSLITRRPTASPTAPTHYPTRNPTLFPTKNPTTMSPTAPGTYRKFRGHYYLFEQYSPTNYETAQARAIAAGGYLVRIDNALENNFVRTMFAEIPGSSKWPWIGIRRCSWDAWQLCYLDTDTVVVGYSGLAGDNSVSEPCMAMQSTDTGIWNSHLCHHSYCYVVEFNNVPVGSGFTGLEPDEDPTVGGTYRKFNGHYYYVKGQLSVTWDEAKKWAENMGGYLARIDSQQENDFLYALVQSEGVQQDGAWFGARRCVDGGWSFCQGDPYSTPLAYQNWAPGEPNSFQNEWCGRMYSRGTEGGRWADHSCSTLQPFLVEFDYKPGYGYNTDSSGTSGGSSSSGSSNISSDPTLIIIVVVVVVGAVLVGCLLAYCMLRKSSAAADPFASSMPPGSRAPAMTTATIASHDVPVLVTAEMVPMDKEGGHYYGGDNFKGDGGGMAQPSAPPLYDNNDHAAPTPAYTISSSYQPSPVSTQPTTTLFSSQPNFSAPPSLTMQQPTPNLSSSHTGAVSSAAGPVRGPGGVMVFPQAVIGGAGPAGGSIVVANYTHQHL